jgi:hypothetical protein
MNKKLYIHIGHYKTGTTALQILLDYNEAHLVAHGFEYSPRVRHHSKHSQLAFAVFQEAGITSLMHGYDDPVASTALWNAICSRARNSPAHSSIISSEELMRFGAIPTAPAKLAEFAQIAEGIDITIIAYLRSPQDHLRSWHNQLVKMRMQVGDFGAAVQEAIEPIHYDYAAALKPWIDTFGADRVVLRDYEAIRHDPTGIFKDFFSVIGLPWRDGLILPDGDPNPRLDDRSLDLVRLIQNTDATAYHTEQLRINAAYFLFLQDSFGRSSADKMQLIRQRSKAGIEALAALPHNNTNLDRFMAGLPQAEDPDLVTQKLLNGFLMNELIAQRKRSNRNTNAMVRRIKALEKKLGIVDTTPDDPAPAED